MLSLNIVFMSNLTMYESMHYDLVKMQIEFIVFT